MKKNLIFLFLFCNFSLAQNYTPEYYEQQANILRHLDIDASFITNPLFADFKTELENQHSKTLIDSMKNFSQIAPMIRKVLEQEVVPEEILYLAMVESGFKTHSVSNAKAVGIWQFMEPTAKNLGLRIDAYVDERRDPVKSTYTATQYLKQLKAEFGKWYLALLAYNCGDGKLRQAIKQAGSDDLSVLLDPDKKYLSLETRIFIKKILILAFLANDKDFLLQKDPSLMNYALNNGFVKVNAPSSVSLKDLAKNIGISFETFKEYNPQFKHDFTPPNGSYYMYIPVGRVAYFNEEFDPKKLAKVNTTIPKTKIYVVKAGDSLYKIAKMHKISANDIKKFNKIAKNHLSINQKLIIPVKENKNEQHKTAKTKTKNAYTQIVSR